MHYISPYHYLSVSIIYICLYIYLSIYLGFNQIQEDLYMIFHRLQLHTYLAIYLYISISIYLSRVQSNTRRPIYDIPQATTTYLYIHTYLYLPISTYLPIYLSVSTYTSICIYNLYIFIHIAIYLSRVQSNTRRPIYDIPQATIFPSICTYL